MTVYMATAWAIIFANIVISGTRAPYWLDLVTLERSFPAFHGTMITPIEYSVQ